MKKRTAYQCDFCKKLLLNITQIKKHESICFYNPKSKSCATCKNLIMEPMLNGGFLTEREMNILEYKVKGTYNEKYNMDPESDGTPYNLLLEQYQYLYNAIPENVCNAKRCKLIRLTTNCSDYNRN